MSEGPHSPSARETLEELLAAALLAHDTGGAAAVAAFLADHKEHAAALNEALTDLHRADLLHTPSTTTPERLGEYRLRGTLGAGGMGIVYLAEQTSLGREVALKVVRPELLLFEGARERFQREIDAVAKLEHPAIVPILATGNADGVPYYSMPRIRGRSADALCRELAGRDPATLTGTDLRAALQSNAASSDAPADETFAGPWWRMMVRLVHQAALGIAHAHARGVLHRDLKPSNLMLTEDGRAIVLDFGLAVARGDARLTRTGAAAGSPAFMAPEQVRGEVADERTDVYGLAATLHCVLALRTPFSAVDAEVLKHQILAGDRRRLPAGLPPELRLVLGQAMDVDRARRYGSATAFAEDLQAVLDGRSIAARGLPAPVRLQRFARRHRVLATALVALGVFVLVVPSVLLWQQRRANELLSEQVRRADRSARVGVDTIENLLAAVARERMLYVPGGQDVAADMLRDALTRFDELATDLSQQARVGALRIRTLQRLADVEKARGRLDDALAAGRRAAQLCGSGELAGAARLQRGEANRILAGLLIDRGLGDEARAVIASSLGDLEPLAVMPAWCTQAKVNLAALHGHAAIMANQSGDLAAQEQSLREAIRCYAEAGERLCQAAEQASLSGLLIARGRPEAALAMAEAVLANDLDSQARPDGWPTPRHVEAAAHMTRGRALQVMGRTDEATVEQQRALALFDRLLHDFPDEPSARRSRARTSHSLAQICIEQQRWVDARQLLERACDDQRRVLELLPELATSHDDLSRHCRKLAQCLEELGDFAALEPLARRVGAMGGDALLPLCGAHSLMCCAAAASDPERAAALREEALLLWLESARRGRPLNFDDPVFAPLVADPRVAALRPR